MGELKNSTISKDNLSFYKSSITLDYDNPMVNIDGFKFPILRNSLEYSVENTKSDIEYARRYNIPLGQTQNYISFRFHPYIKQFVNNDEYDLLFVYNYILNKSELCNLKFIIRAINKDCELSFKKCKNPRMSCEGEIIIVTFEVGLFHKHYL